MTADSCHIPFANVYQIAIVYFLSFCCHFMIFLIKKKKKWKKMMVGLFVLALRVYPWVTVRSFAQDTRDFYFIFTPSPSFASSTGFLVPSIFLFFILISKTQTPFLFPTLTDYPSLQTCSINYCSSFKISVKS